MYENDEEEQLPSNLLPTLIRYKWILLAVIVVLLIITGLAVQLVPSVYRAPANVMVETQQIPPDLVKSTVTAAASQQIDIMRQRVMTRENLLSILNKYDHFKLAKASPIEINSALSDFKRKIKLEVVSTKKGRTKIAIGFSISYASKKPEIARAVTNDLVSLFLSENVKVRTERASETTEFLMAEADKVRLELDKIEAAVAEFKNKNKDSLPEHLNLYVGMREDVRKRVSENEREINAKLEQIRFLTTQLNLLGEKNGSLNGNDVELAELHKLYRQLQLQYQPSHPDLISLREKIKLIESGVDTETIDSRSGAEIDLMNQIKGLEEGVAVVRKENESEKAKLVDLEQRIIKIPQVERGFVSIKRDYESKSEQYESIIAKTQNAEMAESLELGRKAERFKLIEPPVLPITPSEPDKLQLLLMAVAVSFGLPIAAVLAIGFFDKSIQSRKAIEIIVGEPPLVEVPYIMVQDDFARRKRLMIFYLAGAGLVFILAVVTQIFIVI